MNMKTVFSLIAVLAVTGCGQSVKGDDLTYIYTHTTNGGGAGCAVIRSMDPGVLLQCEPGGELVSSCPFDGDTAFPVYAAPGSSPAETAARVDFDSTACDPAAGWRFAQAWTAPQSALAYEVCALDPSSLSVRLPGVEAPGTPCAVVPAGSSVELWVTPEAGPSPYHNSLTVHPM
jgi:hypothetical protein